MRRLSAQNDYLATFWTKDREGLVGLAQSPAQASKLIHNFICEHFPLDAIFRFEAYQWVSDPCIDFGGWWLKYRTIPVTKSMRLHPRSSRGTQGGEDHGEAA